MTELIECGTIRAYLKRKAEHGPTLGARCMSVAQRRLEAARERRQEETLL